MSCHFHHQDWPTPLCLLLLFLRIVVNYLLPWYAVWASQWDGPVAVATCWPAAHPVSTPGHGSVAASESWQTKWCESPCSAAGTAAVALCSAPQRNPELKWSPGSQAHSPNKGKKKSVILGLKGRVRGERKLVAMARLQCAGHHEQLLLPVAWNILWADTWGLPLHAGLCWHLLQVSLTIQEQQNKSSPSKLLIFLYEYKEIDGTETNTK